MSELTRITIQYYASEDRLRCCGTPADGPPVIFWLTQRLLNNLVPHLTAWLEEPHGNGLHGGIVSSFQQEAAVSALSQQDPVPASTAAGYGTLVHSVDLTTNRTGVVLGFKGGEGGVIASLQLAPVTLRQLLHVIHGQYLAGHWNTALWPDWLREAHGNAATPPTRQTAVVH